MSRKRKNLSQISTTEHDIKRSRTQYEDSGEESDSSVESNGDHGRAGRVLKVYLKDFMCHSSLEINLNQNVNYLIGRNGSGKSAILTALIVGLGGKANMTNRGNSMKSFIKVGQTQATVEITLSNDGPMGYRPKVFGKEITVVRIFGETSSRYKLKNEKGEVVSSLFRDVRRLTEALNIQVDNPVCILNQDVARTFLNTNDTSKKHQMFMKATNLESINDQYNLGLTNKRNTVATLNDRKRNLKLLQRELEKWLKKVTVLESVGELEQRKKLLQSEVMWSKVFHIEAELQEKVQEFTECQEEVNKLQNTTESKAQRKKLLQESKETLQNQLREIKQEEESNQLNVNNVKARLHKLNDQIFTKTKTIENLNQMVKRKKRDRNNIETELNTAELSQPNKQQLIQERTKKIEDLQKKLSAVIDLLGTTENDLTQTRKGVEHKIGNLRNIKEEIMHFEGKIAQRKSQIRSLKSDEDNSLSVYGRLMPRLLQAINSAKEQFSEMPRGPVGSYITLKDKKWALAVEEFIGLSMLQSFCVSNSRDSQILNKIMKSVFGTHSKPGVVCSKFLNKVHNISQNKTFAPPDCIALIDALKISDPVITNCLIDQSNIESILLTPSSELSMKLMSQACNVPKNCSRAITIKGDQFYPDPSYRSYAGKQKVPKYLQVNTTELIKQYEIELQTLIENNKGVVNQGKSLGMDVKQLEKNIKELEDKICSLNRAKLKVQDMIEEIKMEELPAEKNFEILREELAEIDKYIENKKFEIDGINKEIEDLNTNVQEVEKDVNLMKKLSKDLNERMKPLINQLDEANVKLKAIDADARYKGERLKMLEDKLQGITEQLDKSKDEYKNLKNHAEKVGPQPKKKRSTEEVVANIEEVEDGLKEISTLVGDVDTVRNTYAKVNTKYEQVSLLVGSVNNTVHEMSSSLDKRARQYHRLMKQIETRVTEMFTNIMELRKFKGSINIDSDKKTLDLNVIPQHGSKNSVHKHILSGGERSYSTVAFLMSLWQVMEYPFYFLDEFDVFMDKVNRRAVMDMLLGHGLDHKNLQFVFLTPQDISTVKTSEHVTIHRMADPERNNHTEL